MGFLVLRSLVTPEPEITTQVRLNGGHYISLQQISSGFRDGPTQRGIEDGWIDEIKGESSVTGFRLMKFWRYFEGPTAGDFTRMHDFLDHIVSVNMNGVGSPKRWMIGILPCVFADTLSNIFPEDYLASADYEQTTIGWTADFWNAATMDRLIALHIAIEDRYGDPSSPNYDPYFEASGTTETAIAFPSTPSGYSDTNLRVQMQRLATEFRAHTPRGQLIFGTNYIGSNDNMYALLNTIRTCQLCSGGPDTWGPQWIANGHRALQGDQCRRGELWTDGGATTLEDMRDTLANQNQVQGPEIGGYMTDESAGRGPFTCEELFDTANNVNRSQYMVWERNTTYGGTEQKWSTGQILFIRDNPLTHTASPYGEAQSEPAPPIDFEYVSVGTPAVADNASISVGFGSTAEAGDLAMVIASITTGSSGRTLASAGYTVIDSYGASSQQPLYVFARVATAAEENATVVPSGGIAGNVVQGVGLLFRDSAALVNVVHSAHHGATLGANNSTPIVTPNLTITADDCIVLLIVTYQGIATDFGTYDPDSDGLWTRIVFATTTTGSDQVLAVYKREQTTAASIGASTLTISGQATGFTARTIAIALKAA